MLYKRNQVEEAISNLVEPKARKPSAGFRTRLKRLMEIDRALGRRPRSSDSNLSKYAFFSADPPGSGVEVKFSNYEGFALLIALQMMAHGWTQNMAVSILRRARTDLEMNHARILKLPREKEAKALTFETNAPILVVLTRDGTTPDGAMKGFACSVHEGYRNAIKWTWENGDTRHGFAMFELASNALKLAARLARTEPRHRGQPG